MYRGCVFAAVVTGLIHLLNVIASLSLAHFPSISIASYHKKHKAVNRHVVTGATKVKEMSIKHRLDTPTQFREVQSDIYGQ